MAHAMRRDDRSTRQESERKKLWRALGRMNGKSFRGSRCSIAVMQDGQRLYLSGTPYLFSAFSERAFELGTDQAEKLIARRPLHLGTAQVVDRK
jgi:hypothetical protein